jgi:hypothetical protein
MSTALEEIGAFGAGIGVAGMVLAGEAKNIGRGGLYSMGMQMFEGYRNAPILSNGVKYQIGDMSINLTKGSDFLSTSKVMPGDIIGLTEDAARSSELRNLSRGGALPGSPLIPAIAIGLTALGGYQRYSEGGGEELGKFLIEDVYANLYGNMAAEKSTLVDGTNIGKIRSGYNLSQNDMLINEKQSLSYYNRIAGSAALGRILPILGAYQGAAMGFSAGEAIGEGLSNMMFGTSSGMGLAGGIMGAKFGAQLGAAMTSNGLRFGLSALAVGGAMMVTSAVGDVLKSGFKHTRNRGLDFAGDLSAYNTNASVTMRQRAVQSMHKSHLNARSALGQEASFQHMNRDYFANHRRF